VSLPVLLAEDARAKVNLTLRVLRRRDDGYHEIDSLVVFADFGDRLSFAHGGPLALAVQGPGAAAAGTGDDNLVLKAARALAARRPDVVLGSFDLDKRLPVAAGLGGGSADAGAALRLIAQANGLRRDDPDLYAAARATGADVPVCLNSQARVMRGIGELLSAPLSLPRLAAVLVNPGVALPTKAVFAGWTPSAIPAGGIDDAATGKLSGRAGLLQLLALQPNDLEAPAIALRPVIANVLDALRALSGCDLARMSGSGATCFGLFSTDASAHEAATVLAGRHPDWWVKATAFGGG
jgi:4-diphosphocytidyl-2-C-methyl-D-erythritol kinase